MQHGQRAAVADVRVVAHHRLLLYLHQVHGGREAEATREITRRHNPINVSK
jgi:hypothetical protein